MGTYLLVHGCNQGGWIWKYVAKYLRAEGHDVYTPTLDGCAERAHQIRLEITQDTMTEELLDYIFYYDLTDLLLVGTSSAGNIISKVADAKPELIKRLFYVDAVLLQPKENFLQEVYQPPEDGIWIRTKEGLAVNPEILHGFNMFTTCDAERSAWASERFSRWPANAFSRVGKEMDFWNKSWDATVINCLRSMNPATSHVKSFAERLKGRYIEMDCGHWPMVCHPEELARILLS
ncbi:MAG: alpha/beta hydrolase [Deltaproteobacteria bacterium]|nr:alpha/beta hydrolase [Deltaproteobacteria bacterium]